MPETMSIERRKLLAAFGAKLVLTEGPKGMNGAIAKAEEIRASDPDRYVLLQQFKNPANPAVHERTTGPEIWEDTKGNIDIFVAGVGTGGTITGVSRYLKKTQGKALQTVAVEPTSSPILTQQRAGLPLQPGPHKIQGIGAGFVPDVLDLSLIDQVEQVSNEDAVLLRNSPKKKAYWPASRVVRCATRLAPENAGKTIVAILPDSERYLSCPAFSRAAAVRNPVFLPAKCRQNHRRDFARVAALFKLSLCLKVILMASGC
jgi:cysteine synthase A